MGWQKWYMRGVQPSGEIGNPVHLSKLRVATPKAPAVDVACDLAQGSSTNADAAAPDVESHGPGLID
jgi:hypothetical protein